MEGADKSEEPSSSSKTIPVKEEPRSCPLCGSVVKFHYLNRHKQFLMCRNLQCTFPFGVEDVHIRDVQDNESQATGFIPKQTQSPTRSTVTTHTGLEIDKCESEDSQLDLPAATKQTEDEKPTQTETNQPIDPMQANIEEIKALNMKLMELLSINYELKDPVWVTKLSNLKDSSGSSSSKSQEKKKKKKQNRSPK